MTTRPAVFCDGCDELIVGGRVIPTVTAEERYQGTDWHPSCWERERRTFPPEGVRPFAELRDTGLLWLINRVVFHPRGYALGLQVTDGVATGWELLGDGTEVWLMGRGIEEDEILAKVNELLGGPKPADHFRTMVVPPGGVHVSGPLGAPLLLVPEHE